MRIDIHSHTAPAKYLEAIRRDPKSMGCHIEKDDQGHEAIVQDNGRSTRVRANLIDPELRLRQMAAEQVDVIVESLLPPLLPLWAPTSIGVRVCQVVNDAVAEDAARYPGRMVGMGIVPFQDVGEAVLELDRIVEQHRMRSVLVPASHTGKNLDEPEFFPFFERAQEHGVLIFIHPHEVAAADPAEEIRAGQFNRQPAGDDHRAGEPDLRRRARAAAGTENLLRPWRRLFAVDSRPLAPRPQKPARSAGGYQPADLRISGPHVFRYLRL